MKQCGESSDAPHTGSSREPKKVAVVFRVHGGFPQDADTGPGASVSDTQNALWDQLGLPK